jgi:hypothetical protein
MSSVDSQRHQVGCTRLIYGCNIYDGVEAMKVDRTHSNLLIVVIDTEDRENIGPCKMSGSSRGQCD